MNAVVRHPVCPLFSRPDLHCPRVDEVLMGMPVKTLKQMEHWCLIRTHYRYEGWVKADCLCCDRGAERWLSLPKKVVWGKSACDVLSRPSFQSRVLTSLPLGAIVAPMGQPEQGWQKVCLPGQEEGYVRVSWLGPFYGEPIDLPQAQLRQKLCDTARLYLGAPYRWGGKTPQGIDCSGLVSMTYLLNGIAICRDAHMEEGFPIHPIDPAHMGPGDLLFFPGHVALYLGDGLYIHSTGHEGSDGVVINSLESGHPAYREDLPPLLSEIGSLF